jgi:hypothetical protein
MLGLATNYQANGTQWRDTFFASDHLATLSHLTLTMKPRAQVTTGNNEGRQHGKGLL